MDSCFVIFAVLGLAVLAAAVLPGVLERAQVSLPMVFVALGALLFALPLGLEGPRPGADSPGAQRLTELVVIVSLMSAGLKLSRPVGPRAWAPTWRLLDITMPLTIAATALLAMGIPGLPVAAAVLLGAVLAPTDPVLASDVQIEGPQVHGYGFLAVFVAAVTIRRSEIDHE